MNALGSAPGSISPTVRPSPGPARVGIAFLALFACYQASEGLQTVFAPECPLGPALMITALLFAWPLGRWLGWRGYDAYGLDLRARSFALLGVGLALAILAKLASLGVGIALGLQAWAGIALPTLPLLTMLLLSTFVPSLVEDILTRGFLLRTLPVRLGFPAYVLASAVVYMANHIWRLGWGPSEQLRLFCLGLAYAAAAWRWRTLWAAVALHWGWNLANALTGDWTVAAGEHLVAGRLLSAGAHLMLLLVLLALPPARAAGDRTAGGTG